jgi:hypothetical protein
MWRQITPPKPTGLAGLNLELSIPDMHLSATRTGRFKPDELATMGIRQKQDEAIERPHEKSMSLIEPVIVFTWSSISVEGNFKTVHGTHQR